MPAQACRNQSVNTALQEENFLQWFISQNTIFMAKPSKFVQTIVRFAGYLILKTQRDKWRDGYRSCHLTTWKSSIDQMSNIEKPDSLSRLPCKQCDHYNVVRDKETGYLQVIPCQNSKRSNKDMIVSVLKEAQSSDKDITMVKEWLEKGQRPSCYFMRSLWTQFNQLSIEDELVCMVWQIMGTNIVYRQTIVPLSGR